MMKSKRRWLLLLKEEEAVVHDACILLPCMRDRKIKGSVSAGYRLGKKFVVTTLLMRVNICKPPLLCSVLLIPTLHAK